MIPPNFGALSGYARIEGIPVGIVANQRGLVRGPAGRAPKFGVGVDDSSELWCSPGRASNQPSLIGDYAYRDAFDARVAGDHFLGVIRLELIEVACVEQAIQYVTHVIGKPMVCRNDVVDISQRSSRTASIPDLHSERLRCRKLGHELAQPGDAFFVVLRAEMRDAGYLVVSQRAA